MIREKPLCYFWRLRISEQPVTSAFHSVEGHRHTDLFQGGFHEHALMVVHCRIMVAMDNEKWRRVLADVGDGAGVACLVRVVPNGASDEDPALARSLAPL